MSLQQVPKLYPWCKPAQWLPFRYKIAVNCQSISTNCVTINSVPKETFGAAFLAAKNKAKWPINIA